MVSSTHSAMHQLGTVLQRLRQMRGLNIFASHKIGNGARKFQDAMISPRGQIELTHCRTHQTLTLVVQFAKLADLRHAHIGITHDLTR